jgi:excisionase family DNA binding protein
METGWMSAEETAASLHITKATLYKLVHEGRVPARKQHGRWVFHPKDIEELFAGSGSASAAVPREGADR